MEGAARSNAGCLCDDAFVVKDANRLGRAVDRQLEIAFQPDHPWTVGIPFGPQHRHRPGGRPKSLHNCKKKTDGFGVA